MYINVSTSINVNGVNEIKLYAVCFETEPLDESVIQTLVFNKRGLPEAKYSVVEMTMEGDSLYVCNVLQMYDDINNQNLKNITSSDSPFVYIVTITTDGSTALNGTMKTVTLVDKNLSLSDYYDKRQHDIMVRIDAQDPAGYTMSTETVVRYVYDLSQSIRIGYVNYPYRATTVFKNVKVLSPFDGTNMTLSQFFGNTVFSGSVQFGIHGGSDGVYADGDLMKKNDAGNFSIFTVCSFGAFTNSDQCLISYYRKAGSKGFNILRRGNTNEFTMTGIGQQNYDALSVNFENISLVPLLLVQRYERVSESSYNFYFRVIQLNTLKTLIDSPAVLMTDLNTDVLSSPGGYLIIGGDVDMYSASSTSTAKVGNFKVGECIFYNEFFNTTNTNNLCNLLIAKWRY